MTWQIIVPAIISATVALVSAIIAARTAARKTRDEATLPPYEQLSADVRALWVEVDDLRVRLKKAEDEVHEYQRAWTALRTDWGKLRESPVPPEPIGDTNK